jgi:hypothetical protein
VQRPVFVLERLREINPEHLVYESVKPGTGGCESLILTPMQLLNRLTALFRRRAAIGITTSGCWRRSRRGVNYQIDYD